MKKFLVLYYLTLIMAFCTGAAHAQAAPFVWRSPTGVSYEAPDPQNTPWTLYQGDSPVPTPAPSGGVTTYNVNAAGYPDSIGADSSLAHSGSYIPKGWDFQQGFVLMGFQPPSSVALMNDGNAADGAAELRILGRPSDQCFAIGEDYYLPPGFGNPPNTHGRLIMIDWCKGGKVVFSKDFGSKTWGLNHNQLFSQAYPSAYNNLQGARGAFTQNAFIAEFWNSTPNAPIGHPVPNPPGDPASGEAVSLDTEAPNGQYYSLYLQDGSGNIITEPIPTALLPQTGVTSQYPAARLI